MFLADLTPVTQYGGKEGNKLMPNSNTMFEYGYAIGVLGESRCKQFVFLESGRNMTMMPFDINHRKTLLLKQEDLDRAATSKKGERNTNGIEILLEEWILDCIAAVNAARLERKPIADGLLSFTDTTDQLTINPIFERISYFPKPIRKERQPSTPTIGDIIQGSLSPDWIEATVEEMTNTQSVKPQIAKVITETNFDSRVPINLTLSNTGQQALENIQIFINLPNDCAGIFYEVNKKISFELPHVKSRYGSIFVNDNQKEIRIRFEILNPGLRIELPTFYFLPPFEAEEIELGWLINTKSFSKSGMLTIDSNPIYEDISATSDEKAYSTDYREKITES